VRAGEVTLIDEMSDDFDLATSEFESSQG